MTEILKKVKAIISETSGIPEEELIRDVPMDSIGLSSITLIEVVVRLEQELGIELDDEVLDLSNFTTLNDLYQAIEE